MKKLLLVLLVATANAFAVPPAGSDACAETLRRSIGVPRMAIAIVEDGKTALARFYGVCKLGAGQPPKRTHCSQSVQPARR